jgi:predicted ABC-class ATPase
MQLLISSADEPITPFVDRVRALWRDHGVSTVLVLGGSGDYFEVADLVVAMKRFRPEDVTAQARRIAAEHAAARRPEPAAPLELPTERVVKVSSLDPSRGRKDVRVRTRGTDSITFGRDDIDLSAVEQLVATSQLRAIAEALVWARSHADPEPLLPDLLDAVADLVDARGLDALTGGHRGDLAEFRPVDLAAAINRLRSVVLE